MATKEAAKEATYHCADCGKSVKAPENKPQPSC